MPPPRSVSSRLEPVVMEMSSLRRACISVAVVNPIGTNLAAIVDKECYLMLFRGIAAWNNGVALTFHQDLSGLLL